MPKKKIKHIDTMAVDLFERQHRQEIEWRTEQILGPGPFGNDYSDAYDAAYEQAVEEIAESKGITLL
jgi:hypothetical protein